MLSDDIIVLLWVLNSTSKVLILRTAYHRRLEKGWLRFMRLPLGSLEVYNALVSSNVQALHCELSVTPMRTRCLFKELCAIRATVTVRKCCLVS